MHCHKRVFWNEKVIYDVYQSVECGEILSQWIENSYQKGHQTKAWLSIDFDSPMIYD